MDKEKLPLLSVIVPIYGVEKYLDNCIKSILMQSYSELDIILVDDGSPDRCPEICDKWSEKDSRIRVIHKENGGLSDARNAGIDIAKGEYLAFVDSDDFIEREMYSIMMEAALRTNSDIVCCGRYMFDDYEKIPLFCLPEETIFDNVSALKEILVGNIMEEAAWDKIYRKKLFSGVYYPIGEINEDIVVIPTLLERCNQVVHIGKPLYNYRFTSTGITKSTYNDRKHIYLKHIYQVRDYVINYYPSLRKESYYFSGRYSYALLLGMAIDRKCITKYSADYKEYRKILFRAFPYMLFSKYTQKKDKIQIILLLLGLYNAIWRWKHGYNFDL